jgi:general secretion pathway protein H
MPALGRCRTAFRGYTLVELLVVLALFGILLGIAALRAAPDPKAKLLRDAERLQTLFGLAAEEAQLRARPMAWSADEHGYAFFLRDADGWQLLDRDEEFKRRSWEAGTVQIELNSAAARPSRLGNREAIGGAGSIEFPRDGLQQPFTLALTSESKSMRLRGDASGRYSIEEGG